MRSHVLMFKMYFLTTAALFGSQHTTHYNFLRTVSDTLLDWKKSSAAPVLPRLVLLRAHWYSSYWQVAVVSQCNDMLLFVMPVMKEFCADSPVMTEGLRSAGGGQEADCSSRCSRDAGYTSHDVGSRRLCNNTTTLSVWKWAGNQYNYVQSARVTRVRQNLV